MRNPVGQTLIERGLISRDQLAIALKEQAQQESAASKRTGSTASPEPLGRILAQLGFLDEATLAATLGEAHGHAPARLAEQQPQPEALALVPRALAETLRILPLAYTAQTATLTLAMAAPTDLAALDRLRAHLAQTHGIAAATLRPLQAGDAELALAWDTHYGHCLEIESFLAAIDGDDTHATLTDPPVAGLIDALLADAIRHAASDLHFEPEAAYVRIRVRIDGVLRPVRLLHASYWPALAVRIKVLASLNIAENRAPQDGHFTRRLAGRTVDFRVSVHPVLHGENIVLRLLDRKRGIVPLSDLGLEAAALAQVHAMLARPEGLLLVIGPTGCGKTTTLYALVQALQHESINIMTLEDPVEYPLPGICQTAICDAVKLDFASGIRSLLRQDPDVILVGEIRDEATAQMALRAAMTGHRVLATLHANTVLGAFARLADLGVSARNLSGNLSGIIGQRLLRRLCPHCATPHPLTAAEAALFTYWLGAEHAPQRAATVGCAHCAGQGYRGRLAIMELLCADADIDAWLAAASDAPLPDVLRSDRASGRAARLQAAALRAVQFGLSTLEEACRVVHLPISALTPHA